jgi:glycosyltransferase involved in cell wall biosynthesis
MKNKIKKVGLYNPYLDTLGGGEKHIFSILEVFFEQGYEINIFWDKNLVKEIKERFALRYIDASRWLPNIFTKKNALKTLRTLRTFDYFFYVTDGSYFFSSAKKNFVFCMVPDKKLYNLNLLNRLKLLNYEFISNSPFTAKWLIKWGINPTTIPPYIDERLFINDKSKKEKIILAVGRFFHHLHSKNQEEIIKVFKKLKNISGDFTDYKLVLAGGLKKEDEEYFNKLKTLTKNDASIIFKPNLSLYELYRIYKLSDYFWHFTGLGVDENEHPEQVEHFGIAPLEAMASGCLTFCYSAGGPKTLIDDGKNGFLFSSANGLINKMIKTSTDISLKEKITENGQIFVRKNFTYKIFKRKVLKLF